MTTGFNADSWSKTLGLTIKKPQIEQNIKNGKMYETQKLDGKVVRTSIFEDLNHDGKFSENEIIQVEQYDYWENGSVKTKVTYYDNNHDGYSDDKYYIDTYSELGNPEKTIIKNDKNLQEMKLKAQNGRCCDKKALGNREMDAHRNGTDHTICY